MQLLNQLCVPFEAGSVFCLLLEHVHGTPQFDPFHQFKIGREWRVEHRKIPRLPESLDHYSAPHYSDVIMNPMASQITSVLIIYYTVCSGEEQKNTKASRHWSVWEEFTGNRWIPHSQRWIPHTKVSDAEHVSIWWRHHKTGNIDVGDECSSMNRKWVLPRRNVF